MNKCGIWSVIAEGDDGEVLVHPLACRSWQCPRCRKRNARILLQRLGTAKVTTLLTLTCNPSAHTGQPAAFRAMSRAVNSLFKRIRRQWPAARVEYFLVWERTRRGWPHAHLLLQAPFVPQAWLSAAWDELTGARVVDIRAVHTTQQVTSYLAKYLAKDPFVPQGMKRYRSSRRFFDYLIRELPRQDRPTYRWSLVRRSAGELATEFSRAGLVLSVHPDGSFQAWPRASPHAPLYESLALHPELTTAVA